MIIDQKAAPVVVRKKILMVTNYTMIIQSIHILTSRVAFMIYLVGLSSYSCSDAIGRQQGDLLIGQAQKGHTGVMDGRILVEQNKLVILAPHIRSIMDLNKKINSNHKGPTCAFLYGSGSFHFH